MDPQQRLLAEARYLLAEAGYAALRLRGASALVTMQMEEQKQLEALGCGEVLRLLRQLFAAEVKVHRSATAISRLTSTRLAPAPLSARSRLHRRRHNRRQTSAATATVAGTAGRK